MSLLKWRLGKSASRNLNLLKPIYITIIIIIIIIIINNAPGIRTRRHLWWDLTSQDAIKHVGQWGVITSGRKLLAKWMERYGQIIKRIISKSNSAGSKKNTFSTVRRWKRESLLVQSSCSVLLLKRNAERNSAAAASWSSGWVRPFTSFQQLLFSSILLK